MSTSELAHVLFTTTLQPSVWPSPEEVRAAIDARLRVAGPEQCAAYVAREAGDHPETYLARMRWALQVVAHAYSCQQLVAA